MRKLLIDSSTDESEVNYPIKPTHGGYMEMMEYKNSARGHLIALENKGAMEGYLEEMMQGTKMKQKAYLDSFEMHSETIDQLVSLSWTAVILRHFEEEMRTTRKIHAPIAVRYVRTDLQLSFAWCMTGLTMEESDPEERKRSKVEKVLLMTTFKRPHDPERNGSSVCETERRSVFRPIHERANINARIEYLCQDAEIR